MSLNSIIYKGGIMSKTFFIFLALSLVGSGLFAGNSITIDEAKAISADTNKPILLDFFTEW